MLAGIYQQKDLNYKIILFSGLFMQELQNK
jgi:hypothetical protein